MLRVRRHIAHTQLCGASTGVGCPDLAGLLALLASAVLENRDLHRVRCMLDIALLSEILASAPDAIVVVDAAGFVHYANRQLTLLFGYESSELIGQRIEVLLPERLRQSHALHRQAFHRNLRVRPMGAGMELFARRKDGSELPVEISLSPIGTGEQGYVAASIRDATDRRNSEMELREARTEADRANLAKSRFLATASHDLRQPLQALALLNGMLRRSVHEPAALDAVEQQGKMIALMSRLLTALLDLSKLESGATQVQVTDFDLGPLLAQLRDEFQVLATGKGLQLLVDDTRVVARTDRTLLLQVLQNLLGNAIKYTEHGSVCVRCRTGEGSIFLDVVDTGAGISAGNLSGIFDEFFQVDPGSQSARQGYGLGLSIVQRIVRLLGMRIGVKSVPGAGSTFTLELPAGTRATGEPPDGIAARQPRPDDHGDCSILLVEDDAGVRKATQMFLQCEGYRVTTAASLAEALECCRQMPAIDLILSDYHLAGTRGTEVIAALRKHAGVQLPSILMTGDTSTVIRDLPHDDRQRIISKPVDADELLDLIGILTNQSTR
jgi:PAS domain S-box-containing protein